MNVRLLSKVLAILAVSWALPVFAQKPVYLCGGTYTDQPCKEGREVDIAPTRGLNAMSGKKQESSEVMQERIRESSERARQKGAQEAQRLIRCAELRRQRVAMDSASQDKKLVDTRLMIREEQFKLNCSRT